MNTTLETPKSVGGEMAARLEQLWNELVCKSPNGEQLLSIVWRSSFLRERAWQAFVALNLDERKLVQLLHANSQQHLSLIRKKIALLIIERYPNESTLLMLSNKFAIDPDIKKEAMAKLIEKHSGSRQAMLSIVDSSGIPSMLRMKAAEKLITPDASASELRKIVIHTEGEVAARAGTMLLEHVSADIGDLWDVMRVESLRTEAWKLLKERGMKPEYLSMAVVCYPEAQIEAAEMLLALDLPLNSTFNLLFPIFQKLPNFRERAWQKLEGIGLSEAWCCAIAREAPEFAERAKSRLVPEPRTAEVVIYDIWRASEANRG